MKKNINLILFVLVTFASMPNLTAFSQCCNVPRGSLQIPNTVYDLRTQKFAGSPILAALNRHCGGGHPKSAGTMPLKTFFDFLELSEPTATGLKIYFGAFDQPGSTSNNNLVPIYVFTLRIGTGPERADFGPYYIYDPQFKKFVKISQPNAEALYRHFVHDLEMGTDEVHTLWYPKDRLTKWMADICCQQSRNPPKPINTIKLDWAVYEKNINDPITGANILTDKKLTLLFSIPNANPMARKVTGDYDTAVPCPPGQNCDGDGLDCQCKK